MPRRNKSWRSWMLALASAGLICSGAIGGCSKSERADVVPASGKVLLDGKPLEFGTVAFQPMRGQPARGTIGKDGTFKLSTYREGDGAAVGQHRVKITCFTSQDPAAKKPGPNETLGESLIPARYANFDTSGLTVAVLADGNKPFELKLESGTKSGETAEGGKVETSESEAKAADEAAKPIDDAAQSAPVDVGAPAATQPAADAAAAEVKTDAK